MLIALAHTRADAQQISRDLFRTGTGKAAWRGDATNDFCARDSQTSTLISGKEANFITFSCDRAAARRKKPMRKRGSSSCANLTSCYHHTPDPIATCARPEAEDDDGSSGMPNQSEPNSHGCCRHCHCLLYLCIDAPLF